MHTHAGEKADSVSLWLRVGGTLIGAVLGALGAAVLFFVAALLNVLSNEASFQMFLTSMAFAGGCIGFMMPRQTLGSLWFFFPEIFDRP